MIEEIKDIKKLRKMLKQEIERADAYYDYAKEAGKILEKYSYGWDGKPKYLGLQAAHLNRLYAEQIEKNKKLEYVLTEIREIIENCINPEYPAFEQILQKIKEVLDER